ncbi:MAG: tetratricopeptide repeat protein [Myxococcota bacterium]
MSRRNHAQSLVERGLLLQQRGEADEAIRAFADALEVDPQFFDAAYQLGRAYETSHQWTRAVDAFRAANDLDPHHGDTATALAECLRQASCFYAALDAYETSLTITPGNPWSHAGRGESNRMLARYTEAVADFDAALEQLPDHAFALRGRAACHTATGAWAEALQDWDAALALEPNDAFATSGRATALRGHRSDAPAPADMPQRPAESHMRPLSWGRALASDGRVGEALPFLETALEVAPEHLPTHLAMGDALMAARRWNDALKSFRAAAAVAPHDETSAARIGDALRKAGRFDEATEAYEDALTKHPRSVAALTGLAETLRLSHQNNEALETFDRAIEVDNDYVPALRGKASSLNAMGRYDDALPLWRQIVELEPDNAAARRGLKRCEIEVSRMGASSGTARPAVRGVARIHFDLGKSMLQQDRHKEAIAAFKQAAGIRQDWADPWFYIGIAHERADQLEPALQAFEQAITREPDHLEAGCRRGDILRKQDHFKQALHAYGEVIQRHGDIVHALSGRAECLRMLGEIDEALLEFDKALAQNPEDFTSLCGKAAVFTSLKHFDQARELWLRARDLKPSSVYVLKGLAQCDLAVRNGLDRLLDDLTSESVPAGPPTTPDDEENDRREAAADELDRGRSYHKERKYEAAIQCFMRALEIDDTFAEAAVRLGMAYEDDRQFRRAISAYERCLKIEPDHFQAATNIGEAYRKNEQYHEAIDAYDRALTVKSDYLYALAGRAECMRMLGRFDASLEWFDRALAVGPTHAFAIQGKAAALNALQHFDEAMEFWNKALEIEPQSQFALDGKAYCEAQLRRGDAAARPTRRRRPTSKPGATKAPEPEAPESTTPTLDEQGRNLSQLAADGKLPQVIGREKEMRAVMKTLVRRLKANPLLLGDPGVGKTAVVEGVAQRLADGQCPEKLKGLKIIELSMGTLVAGTKYRGTFEERLREIIKEASSEPGIVLFIDEIHTLVGAGRTEGGSLDAANILKPALARGEITVIGATTLDEYRQHFESDSALDRRFQPIQIDEPSRDECIELLGRLKGRYEAHHSVEVHDDALGACVDMAVRFVPDRRLPDKALDMLDEACAEASLSGDEGVNAETVARVVSDKTGIPVTSLTAEERERLSSIADALGDCVFGQSTAIAHVANAVRLSKAGLRDPQRPRGVFLFKGPSGVGKTELAKSVADFLFPEGDALIRIDMSEFSDRYAATRLMGPPPGFSKQGDEGILSGPLRRKPYSVVLLDEFEKAHPEVQSLFLPLLDEGVTTDSEGRTVSAREAFFILTTNAGSAARSSNRMGFGSDTTDPRSAALEDVRPYFSPELLNRIDEVISFNDLASEDLEAIVRVRLEELSARATTSGITLTWDPDVPAHIVAECPPAQTGARPVLRSVDTLIGEPLGEAVLKSSTGRGHWVARLTDGEIVFEPAQEALDHQEGAV